MDDVLDAVVIGRACRNSTNIKNRQPIGKMFIKADWKLDEFYTAIIADELNVKEVEYTDDVRAFTSYSFKPQMKTLGPKYGKLLNAIRTALTEVDGNATMDKLNESGSFELNVEGQAIELSKDDVLIEMTQKEGFVASSDKGITVVLDTNLTPDTAFLCYRNIDIYYCKCYYLIKKNVVCGEIIMIKIAICDDDIDFMDKYDERIIDIFNKCTMGDETYSVVRYHSGKELLDNYKKDGADIFLLDIDLGDCKGYEVGRELTLRESDPAIIYITGYSENVYNAFVGRPIGFVQKKCLENDLEKFVYAAVYHVRKRAQRVEITGKDRKYELAADEIVVFEVYDHELKITLKDGEKILNGSLHTYEEKLEEYGFIKISRSVMLNPRYIKNISGDEAVMINGSIYKISRSRRKNVRREYELCTRR